MTAKQFIAIRRQLGLSQEGLAMRLRVDVQTVARYETGKTPVRGPVSVLMEVLGNYNRLRLALEGTDGGTNG